MERKYRFERTLAVDLTVRSAIVIVATGTVIVEFVAICFRREKTQEDYLLERSA